MRRWYASRADDGSWDRIRVSWETLDRARGAAGGVSPRLRYGAAMRTRLAVLLPDLTRGVRAAIATVVPFYLAVAYAEPALAWVAIGGWLGSLADPGGTRRVRAVGMAWFVGAGGLAVAIAGLATPVTWLAAACVAAIAFAAAMVRALGGNAGSIGNIIAIAAAIAATATNDRPALAGLMFAAGATWAVLSSSIIWPLWPHLPVRRVMARSFAALADYARALREVARDPAASEAAWSIVARTHQRTVRAAIEAARATMVESRARRSGESPVGANLRVVLGLADAQFFKLIALAEVAAHSDGALDVLDEIIAIDDAIGACLLTRREGPAVPRHDATTPLGATLVESARAALALARDLDVVATGPAIDEPPRAAATSVRALRDALTRRSPILRHGLRVAVNAASAIVLARLLSPEHPSWIAVTAIAVLQPQLGPTLVRLLERVVGTIFGGGLAVGILALIHTPLALALTMIPLSILAVVTRPRSYSLFVVFLTPVFLMVADHWHADSSIAAVRIADVAIGGAIALVAALIVPSTERRRLPDALIAMLDALAAHVACTAAVFAGTADRAALPAGRRARGIALEDAEASLERMLAEPRLLQRGPRDAMFLVTYARRLAATVTALDEHAAVDRAAPRSFPTEVSAYALDAIAAARALIATGARVEPRDPPLVPPQLARLVSYAALIRGLAVPAALA
ncbi:MAG: FUSC family protein [Deltaproteobacteria bacterium]|nr:FUSC family protein [Deltaproteobacteria bacterium]